MDQISNFVPIQFEIMKPEAYFEEHRSCNNKNKISSDMGSVPDANKC